MFSIVITERGGAQRKFDFERPEVSIGRLDDNDICLPKNNVSKRHSRLVLRDERYVLFDLKSTNGTYVNGRRISSPMVVRTGDKVYIGDFILTLVRPSRSLPRMPSADPAPGERDHPSFVTKTVLDVDSSAPPPPPQGFEGPTEQAPRPSLPEDVRVQLGEGSGQAAAAQRASSSMPPRVQDPASGQGPATSAAVLSPSLRLQGALATVMERLAERVPVALPHESAFTSDHRQHLDAIVADLVDSEMIAADLDRGFLLRAAISEAVGLGPLDRLLTNQAMREIVVDGPSRVLADVGGGLSTVSLFFSSSAAVQVVAQRLFARAGGELTSDAIQEITLPDGSQVQAMLPPLAADGPLISVRCPARSAASPEGLVTEGVLSLEMLSLLRRAAHKRLNVLVVGHSARGVAALLGAVASLVPDHERIVVVQEAPTLAIDHPYVLRINRDASGCQLRGLLHRVRRLRPDRLVIDDVRPDDAMSVLLFGAASPGLCAGMGAADPRGALDQLSIFAQLELGGEQGSLARLSAQAFRVLVHVVGDDEGHYRVESISELIPDAADPIVPLLRYDDGFVAAASF